MKIDKKVSSMTINEMLVVIIISTIVIGMAFSVLNMVQKHMWSIQKNITDNTSVILLEQSLWVDFNNYNTINYSPEEHKLIFKSELDSVSYNFGNMLVTKKQDTFKLSTKQKYLYFNGNRIESGKIDALKLELGNSQKEKIIFVFKRKDANQFMN